MDRRRDAAGLWLAVHVWIFVHLRDESGTSATEYAVLIALIALAMVVTATALGQAVGAQLDRVATGLDTAGAS